MVFRSCSDMHRENSQLPPQPEFFQSYRIQLGGGTSSPKGLGLRFNDRKNAYSPDTSFHQSPTHPNLNLETNKLATTPLWRHFVTIFTRIGTKGKVISGPSLLVDRIINLAGASSISDLVGNKWAGHLLLGKLNDLRGFFFVQCPNHLQHL